MNSETIALEMPTLVDTEAARRELVAYLSLGTIGVWAYAVIAAAQTIVF